MAKLLSLVLGLAVSQAVAAPSQPLEKRQLIDPALTTLLSHSLKGDLGVYMGEENASKNLSANSVQ